MTHKINTYLPFTSKANKLLFFTRGLIITGELGRQLLRSRISMSTCYTEEQIRSKLQTALNATFVDVEDLSDGCGGKFRVVVVSQAFVGESLLARQRMVHAALEEEMKSIHALTMKTYTVEQHEALTSKEVTTDEEPS